MVFGFHCTLCQFSVVLQTSNDMHILTSAVIQHKQAVLPTSLIF